MVLELPSSLSGKTEWPGLDCVDYHDDYDYHDFSDNYQVSEIKQCCQAGH